MKELQWSEKLALLNKDIDLQHQYFVELINRIINQARDSTNRVFLAKLLEELYLYAKFHFFSEHNIFVSLNVPNQIIESHDQEHDRLLKELQGKLHTVHSSQYDVSELVRFSKNWYIRHSLADDRMTVQSSSKIKSRFDDI